MYKIIKHFFTHNLYLKALSILMAIILWFVVMNINNPTEIKAFTPNISILNEEKLKENNIAVLNIDELKNQKTEIRIKAPRATLDKLTKKYNRDNMKLILDLEQLTAYKIGDKPLEVNVNLKTNMPYIPYPNNNFEIVNFYPITYTLYIDNIITIPKKIHPKIIGKTKSNYIVSDAELSSEYIQVTGPKSIVDKIEFIYAEIDITDQTSTIEKKVKPVAYDKEGNEITDISFNIEDVLVKVPISLQGFVNIGEPKLTGKLLEGYIINSISYEPRTVQVIGDTNDLKQLTKINLPDIDLSSIKESTKYTYDIEPILKQYNLRLKNSYDSKINIFINIKSSSVKSLNLPTSKISILGYNDKFFIDMPEEFIVNISGDSEIINSINPDELNFNIDVTGLDIGNHSVNVNIEAPKDVKVSFNSSINLTISNKDNVNESTEDLSQDSVSETTTIKEETSTEDNTIIEENSSLNAISDKQEPVKIENESTSNTETTTNNR